MTNEQVDLQALEQAATLDDPEAQYQLGATYLAMEGIEKRRKGVGFLTKAANLGNPAAQHLLGSLMAENEDRIPGLYEQGVSWLLRAAEQEYVEAQTALAYLYLLGRGVPADEKRAYYWYEKAAHQGVPALQSNLAYMHAHGIGTAKNQATATAWYLKAAGNGDRRALYNLGLRCERGIGIRPDPVAAGAFFRLAVESDYPGSRDALDRLYLNLSEQQRTEMTKLDGDAVNLIKVLEQGGVFDELETYAEGVSGEFAACMRAEVVSWSPRAFKFHNFLSYDECDHLVDLAIRHAGPSEAEIGRDIGKSFHTGLTTFFKLPICDATVYNLEQRIARTIMVPADHGEILSVMHFNENEDYSTHVDFFRPEIPVMKKLYDQGGQRIITFLMYLSDVEEGGETAYVNTDKKIRPRKGMAATHFNCLPSGEVDEMSLHAGLQVRKGEKWFARKAIRERSMFAPIAPGEASCQQNGGIGKSRARPGRNDPCPCGSGKKYKKCCGA